MRSKLPLLLLLVACLIVAGYCVLSAQQQSSISYPSANPLVYYVIASDAPSSFKRSGPNVEICSGSGDEVQIQAAIDAAEATGLVCNVMLSPGTYDMDNPIYIGYSGTPAQPNQTLGCNLLCAGRVLLDYDLVDLQKFGIYFSPAAAGRQPRIEGPLEIQGGTRAGGIYSTGLNAGVIRNVRVDQGQVAGIWCNDSWIAILADLRITGQWATAIGVTDFNAGRLRDVALVGNTGFALGGSGSYYGNNKYSHGGVTGAFWPGEEVKLLNDAGTTKGVVLAVSSSLIWVGHSSTGVFVDTNVIYGDDSTATCTINAVEEEIGSCLYLYGGTGNVQNLAIDGCNYADEASGDYEYPLILVDSSQTDDWSKRMVLEKVRIEATISGSDMDLRRMAQTYIEIDHADGTVIRDLDVYHKAADSGGVLLRDNSVDVNGDGDGTSTVLNVSDEFIAALADGDSVYLWDGGANDGLYSIEAGYGSNTFGISDGDFTDGDNSMFCWALTASTDRLTPGVLVDIIDAEHVLVENVRANTFRTAFVRIDANCVNCEVRNILPYAAQIYGNTEGTWLFFGAHGVIVSDAGTGTKLTNPFVPDYTGLIYVGKTGIEVVDETDGITHKTTLLLKDQTVTLADEAGVIAHGGQKVFDFPAGAILIEGVTTDLDITKSSAGVNADWDGDYSVGSVTASNNNTLTTTEDEMLPSTATPQASSSATTADGQSTAAENVVVDGTSTDADAFLNFLVDDADHNVAGTPCNLIVNGTITIHWRNLGDY